MLRTDGLNEFAVADISSVSASALASYGVVLLAKMPLTGANVTTLTDWVNGGGKLIAMAPDAQLASLLGITPTGSTLSNGYLRVDTTTRAGSGIVGQTMQFHGTADRYTLSGASGIARLYNDTSTASS